MRWSARGMPTALSSSSARDRAARFETSRCSRIASMSCTPMFFTGFSDVIGSWKIIAISSPRMPRNWREFILSRSLPFQSACPELIVFTRGLRPMIVRQVTLLPEPDSPTMPSVLPFSTWKLTPSTALTTPSSVRKCVRRSFTSRRATGLLHHLGESDSGVDDGVQKVDDEVEHDDRDRREHHHALHRRQVEVRDRSEPGRAETW